jgi:histidine triad (HIT) family protein
MNKCLFCKIVKGEIPSKKVYETDFVLVIKDINPHAPVHDLVIPKKHLVNLNDITGNDKELLADILLTCAEVARIEGIDKAGYRVIENNGKNGGQLIGHLHLHILGGKDLGPKLVNE